MLRYRRQERVIDEDMLELSTVARSVLEGFLSVNRELTEHIHQLEAVFERTAMEHEETQRLMSIPGVSYFSSVLILSEIENIERFDRVAEFVSYAGLEQDVRRHRLNRYRCRPINWLFSQSPRPHD